MWQDPAKNLFTAALAIAIATSFTVLIVSTPKYSLLRGTYQDLLKPHGVTSAETSCIYYFRIGIGGFSGMTRQNHDPLDFGLVSCGYQVTYSSQSHFGVSDKMEWPRKHLSSVEANFAEYSEILWFRCKCPRNSYRNVIHYLVRPSAELPANVALIILG